MIRKHSLSLWVIAATVPLSVLFAQQATVWSAKSQPAYTGSLVASAHGAFGGVEALQQAFIRIAKEVGPSVVSISTEQIEQVRQYFRVHPFFGYWGDPFEEFFQQHEGPQREFRRFGLGSGVIVQAEGYILTNEHVVGDADKITVALSDGREFTGQIRGTDPRSDLAIIQIEAKELTVARLGDSSRVTSGQWSIALGNPFGLMGSGDSTRSLGTEPTLTVGVISATGRNLPSMSGHDRDYSGLIQTDAAINPGNSGGPLLNLAGEVIGINVAILTSSRGYEGIGFAIPVNKAKRIMATLIEGKDIEYGWLGVQIQTVQQDVAEYYGLKDKRGVLVWLVLPDSPAERSGMQDGDIIRTFDGAVVAGTRELIERVSSTTPSRKIKIGILRDGQQKTLQVSIGARPRDPSGVSVEVKEPATMWRGLKVGALTPEWAEHFGLKSSATGVVVLDVEDGSMAGRSGLRPGNVINEINRVRVKTTADYERAIDKVRGNVLVRTNRGYFVIKKGF